MINYIKIKKGLYDKNITIVEEGIPIFIIYFKHEKIITNDFWWRRWNIRNFNSNKKKIYKKIYEANDFYKVYFLISDYFYF